MSTNNNENLSQLTGTSIVSREMIDAAMQRGRRERSKAFWSMLQTVFSRPEGADEHGTHTIGDRNAAPAR